jgi:hypothetical protein
LAAAVSAPAHRRHEDDGGTQAMFVTAGLAIFFTFLFYAGQPWQVSLTVALLVAPVCAAVELFSNRGMDT